VTATSGRISERTVEAVKERSDLVELVEARMGQGRRSGGQVMFRCPFHDEATPSCRVHPAAKTFHCFGCGEGGDVIAYVRKLENLSFAEAVEWLADRYGIDVEREDLSPHDRDRIDRTRRIDGLLEDVSRFYQRYLETADEAAPARAYLAERGVAAASIERFRLGFAPDDWDRVVKAARAKGYADEQLIEAGVASAGKRGPIDRFRGRITFPLTDARGRVRGFGARVMPGGDGPKYLNSSESDLFKKGRILYGLDLARSVIARRKRAIVVEGYTDVIALHAAGFEESVAAMGTSLTEDQVRELRRLTDAVVLCFDADAAGQGAALRGMEIAERSGLRVRIAGLPAGQDPADLLKQGAEAFEAALAASESVLAFRIGRILASAATDGADAAYGAARVALAAAAPGPERDEQVRRVAGTLRLGRETEAALVPGRSRMPTADPSRSARRRDPRVETELQLLAACLALPASAPEVLADADLVARLSHPRVRALVGWVRDRAAGSSAPAPDGLERVAAAVLAHQADFDVESDDGRRETAIALRKLRVGVELADVEDAIARLKETLRSTEYTREDLERLKDLQGRRAHLRDRLHGSDG
jgi:DNA primase